ncbi:unnamed protein product [Vitrella brassicaformis CCMP3155]|uniref:Uncharacterized protein n=1 Tax=Vitrella brassicaformis (strain CCMP3155) TaxID=1169540 RepID=A0A0G4FCY8_VITBC|nr:unnamed protein product [Vitrella brassicaformis CCMP3155]|eukprot:CEM11036.1 unnamed protein product [Vitrella brassicaformis CCMP3155]
MPSKRGTGQEQAASAADEPDKKRARSAAPKAVAGSRRSPRLGDTATGAPAAPPAAQPPSRRGQKRSLSSDAPAAASADASAAAAPSISGKQSSDAARAPPSSIRINLRRSDRLKEVEDHKEEERKKQHDVEEVKKREERGSAVAAGGIGTARAHPHHHHQQRKGREGGQAHGGGGVVSLYHRVRARERDMVDIESLRRDVELRRFEETIKRMQLTDAPERISPDGDKVFSFGMCSREPLLLAGNKGGALSVYHLLRRDNYIEENLHEAHIAKVCEVPECSDGTSTKVATASYDGTVCVTDLALLCSNGFGPGRRVGSNKTILQSHGAELPKVTALDVASPTTLAFGNDRGEVYVADLRSKSKTRHRLHVKKVGSLSFNPRDAHILASGGNDGLVHIWDLRRVRDPVWSLGPVRAVKTSSFSPDGRSLLISTLDSLYGVIHNIHGVPQMPHNWRVEGKEKPSAYLRTHGNSFHFFDKKAKIPGCACIAHNNNTGLWITDFDPKWHPRIPGVFTSGSLDRKVEVFVTSFAHPGGHKATLEDDAITISSFAAIHSNYDILASISYGNLAIWAPTKD